MSKINLRITLDETFEVELSEFDFEGMSEEQIKTELIQEYFYKIGRGEIEIEQADRKSILKSVRKNALERQILFYEIEFERELTDSEKTNIKNWIDNDYIGELKL